MSAESGPFPTAAELAIIPAARAFIEADAYHERIVHGTLIRDEWRAYRKRQAALEALQAAVAAAAGPEPPFDVKWDWKEATNG